MSGNIQDLHQKLAFLDCLFRRKAICDEKGRAFGFQRILRGESKKRDIGRVRKWVKGSVPNENKENDAILDTIEHRLQISLSQGGIEQFANALCHKYGITPDTKDSCLQPVPTPTQPAGKCQLRTLTPISTRSNAELLGQYSGYYFFYHPSLAHNGMLTRGLVSIGKTLNNMPTDQERPAQAVLQTKGPLGNPLFFEYYGSMFAMKHGMNTLHFFFEERNNTELSTVILERTSLGANKPVVLHGMMSLTTVDRKTFGVSKVLLVYLGEGIVQEHYEKLGDVCPKEVIADNSGLTPFVDWLYGHVSAVDPLCGEKYRDLGVMYADAGGG